MVEDCNNYDSWVDTNITRWVDDPSDQTKEKEQKKQEYQDYSCSNESCTYLVTATQWIDTGKTRAYFSTGRSANPHPSISGTHNGTIRPNETIVVRKLYTYPCVGTGGHIEYAKIWNTSWEGAEAHWNGYSGDWHNITFDNSFPLCANQTYNYTIRTGSYPQIIHEQEYNATGGVITCTEFEDINGQQHEAWIPAIRLY